MPKIFKPVIEHQCREVVNSKSCHLLPDSLHLFSDRGGLPAMPSFLLQQKSIS